MIGADPLPVVVESFYRGAAIWPLVLVAFSGGALAVATFIWWKRRYE